MGIAAGHVILLMFLSNVRTALIVAINMPLALLFAFSVLYLRGKSANLLSIGAVDFGIIVDSSVDHGREHLPPPQLRRNTPTCRSRSGSSSSRTRSTARCSSRRRSWSVAFVPLFTMQGPEGQIFGPMAETYAFALGGALVLALTLTPVLCLLLFKNFKPVPENFLVRALKTRYLRQLRLCLQYPLGDGRHHGVP